MNRVAVCLGLALVFFPALPTLAADSDASVAGKLLFANCSSCHTIERDGEDGIGPNLAGVVGAKAAARGDFPYSTALKNSGITWTSANLDRWLTNPAALVPGNKMGFVGLPKAADRAALIAFLTANSTQK
jgi:cytochrome c